MTSNSYRAALALFAAAGLGGCYHPPTPTRAEAAIRTDCRQAVERQYNAQNRSDLTQRVDRDAAFANSYNAGLTTRGLGAEYHRDQMISDCLRTSGDPAPQNNPNVGQTFSPANAGSSGSTLQP